MNSKALITTLLVTCLFCPATQARPPHSQADVIFFNGNILTMDDRHPRARALAVKDDTIMAVGSTGYVQRLGGPGTRRINLHGKTLLPGIVDPHSHLLDVAPEALDEAQQFALDGGVTSMGNPFVYPQLLEMLQAAERNSQLRVRLGVYLAYNTKCFGILQPEGWIMAHPVNRDAGAMLRVLGIKLFADAGKPFAPFCGWAASRAMLPQWVQDLTGAGPYGNLVLTAQEMAEVIERYGVYGYQAVIHARGDGSVDAALDAIETALGGAPNALRHRVDHNDLVRPDQFARYGEIGALPVVRVRPNFLGANTCYVEFLGGVHPLGEEVQPWARIVRSIIEANPGLPVAWHSDLGGYSGAPGQAQRTPMNDLWELVTRKEVSVVDGHVCEPPEWLADDAPTVERALRMMTIDAAYMLFLEDRAGSLERGKFADLIVLSDDPLSVEHDALRDIDVLMTMVGGKVEHCMPGYGGLCPIASHHHNRRPYKGYGDATGSGY